MKDIKIFLKKEKHQNGCEQYENLPEDQKQSLVESRKKLFKNTKNKIKLQVLPKIKKSEKKIF